MSNSTTAMLNQHHHLHRLNSQNKKKNHNPGMCPESLSLNAVFLWASSWSPRIIMCSLTTPVKHTSLSQEPDRTGARTASGSSSFYTNVRETTGASPWQRPRDKTLIMTSLFSIQLRKHARVLLTEGFYKRFLCICKVVFFWKTQNIVLKFNIELNHR